MPALVAGYSPAYIPPPDREGTGLIADDEAGPPPVPSRPAAPAYMGDERPVFVSWITQPPELRVPSVLREQYVNPAAAYFTRNPGDEDNDAQLANPRGQHVAQTAGAVVAHDSMNPEPPMYGSTFRLDPQPASAGWYIGGE